MSRSILLFVFCCIVGCSDHSRTKVIEEGQKKQTIVDGCVIDELSLGAMRAMLAFSFSQEVGLLDAFERKVANDEPMLKWVKHVRVKSVEANNEIEKWVDEFERKLIPGDRVYHYCLTSGEEGGILVLNGGKIRIKEPTIILLPRGD